MIGTEFGVEARLHLQQQWDRLVRLPLLIQHVGEIVDAVERMQLVGTERRRQTSDGLSGEFGDLIQFTGGAVRDRQLGQAAQCVVMIGTESRLPFLPDRFEERQCSIELRGLLTRDPQVVHGFERIGMVGAELFATQFPGTLKLRHGSGRFTDIKVRHSQRVPHRRLDQRLPLERLGDVRLGGVHVPRIPV